MNRLKIILQSKIIYYFLIIISIIIIIIFTIVIKYPSKYSNETNIEGKIISYCLDEDKLTMIIKGKEKVKVIYYLKENDDNFNNEIKIGSIIKLEGNLEKPINNTIPHTFNYQRYLKYQGINYIFKATNIELSNKANFLNNLKNQLIKRINKYQSSTYLKLFILGDKADLNSDTYNLYQNNGIAHLLAISGMHVSFLVYFIKLILKRIKTNCESLIILLFLLLYLFLTSFTVSILRCFLMYLLKAVNDKYAYGLTSFKIFIITFFILILINPFYIYQYGFIYSMIITLGIILASDYIKGNYLSKLFKISIIAFLFSIPITGSLNYEINLFSIISNLICVPFVSFILFPLSLITLILPFLDNILIIIINLFEKINLYLNNYKIMIMIPYTALIVKIIYYLLLVILIRTKKKIYILLIICEFIFIKLFYKIDANYYIYYLDIGQGDSSILISPYQKEVIMIDTGGSYYYDNLIKNTIVFLKSINISKINLLVITHGDMDHAKEGVNLINLFKVKEVMFNCGDYNNYEIAIKNKGLKEVKTIDYYYFKSINYNCSKESDENQNSIVLLFKIYNESYFFGGDITYDILYNIINKNKLNIDYFHLSHHGSYTGTSDNLLAIIKPKLAIISSGRNNKYHHPHQSVLNLLNKYHLKYLNTQEEGTIMLKINQNNVNIFTFPP